MIGSAGKDFLALLVHHRIDRPHALKIPARRADSTLTENVASPFQAEPRHESGIIDLFAVGNGLDKRLEIASLMEKRVRHVATSPETFSAWSICRREKPPVRAFSGPSVWPCRERGKERRPDPPQGRLVH